MPQKTPGVRGLAPACFALLADNPLGADRQARPRASPSAIPEPKKFLPAPLTQR